MRSTHRLLAVLMICSLSFNSSVLFAAGESQTDLLVRSGIEIDMRKQFESDGLGYLMQAKEAVENLKRMGSKDDMTQKKIVIMDAFLKILEKEYLAKTKHTTYQPTTVTSSTAKLQPGSVMPPSLSTPRRRYRKVDVSSPKTTLLSDDQFNKKLSSSSLPKSGTKNTSVLFKKIGESGDAKTTTSATVKTVVTTKTIQPVTSKTSSSKPSSAPTNKLLQQVLDESKPIKSTSRANGSLNIETLRTTWIGWVNDLRSQEKLKVYKHDIALDITAEARSRAMAEKQTADHKRTSTSKYYAYDEIVQRFADQGVAFELIGNSTFTENVGWTYLNCESAVTPSSDCTEQAINNMRSIFDYFVAEKDQEYRPHWSSMVHPIYSLVGVGFTYDPVQKRLYLTAHYGNPLVRTNK